MSMDIEGSDHVGSEWHQVFMYARTTPPTAADFVRLPVAAYTYTAAANSRACVGWLSIFLT